MDPRKKTIDEVLSYYPLADDGPLGLNQVEARAGRNFRVYLWAPALRRCLTLQGQLASVRRERKARQLMDEVERLQKILLIDRYYFLAEDHAGHIEDLRDDVIDLIS